MTFATNSFKIKTVKSTRLVNMADFSIDRLIYWIDDRGLEFSCDWEKQKIDFFNGTKLIATMTKLKNEWWLVKHNRSSTSSDSSSNPYQLIIKNELN